MKYQKKNFSINQKAASQALQNVLAACDKTPATIPFDKLLLRSKLNTRIYNRLITITVVLLIITFLSPLAVAPMNAFFNKNRDFSKVVVESDYVSNDILYLTLIGNDIMYDRAYQIMEDGTKEDPVSFQIKSQQICFIYHSDQEVNIFIPYGNDQTLHLLVSPEE